MQTKWLGREPALIIQAVAAVLAVGAGFGLPGISDGVIAAGTAFLTALAAAITAWHVRPIAPAVFTGVITTGATVLAAFGLDLPQKQVALISFAALTVMAMLTRQQVTPAYDPSSTVVGPDVA